MAPRPYDAPTRHRATPRLRSSPSRRPRTRFPGASGAPAGTDPWTAPADPAGRHASGTVGEYVDEIEGTGTRRRTDPDAPLDERYDDPYRPGGEGAR